MAYYTAIRLLCTFMVRKGEKSVAYLAAESHDSQGISMPILGYFV
mgnify:CR=1 FL=1